MEHISGPSIAPSDEAHRQRPKLRSAEPVWVEVAGQPHLWLRDRLALSATTLLVPAALAPLLGAMDGTRDLAALAIYFSLRTGAVLPWATIQGLVQGLDEALLLEGPRLGPAVAAAVAAYRDQPFRPPALAPQSYPADAAALAAWLDEFQAGPVTPMQPIKRAAGVLSPHIDYSRGGRLYARTWEAAIPAVASAEVVVIFGTDHYGSPGQLTPTRQHYATPWGPLPTDGVAVDAMATALGHDLAYAEELHHCGEHAIELATVWLHWALQRAGRAGCAGRTRSPTPWAVDTTARARPGAPTSAGSALHPWQGVPSGGDDDLPLLVPILCGSFHPYVQCRAAGGDGESAETPPAAEPRRRAALAALADAIGGRRVLVVAAADLAHVGPAFGDPAGLAEPDKALVAESDAQILAPVLTGDGAAFLRVLRAAGDRYRVCGLPPIYWSLCLLNHLHGRPLSGRLAGYCQCPADAAGGSLVSIAGVLWEE